MSFAELVSRLGLSSVHILVAAHVSEKPVLLVSLALSLHLDEGTIAWVVGDFVRLGLCKREHDVNFISLDVEQILAIANDLGNEKIKITRESLVATNCEMQQVRLHSPPAEEGRLWYPTFRLSRNGWQGGKTHNMNR